MYYTDDDKKRIIDAADGKIIDVINDFITLEKKRSGPSWVGKCPKCGKDSGFEVNEGKQAFSCFHCKGISGVSSLTFLMKAADKSYPEALDYLAHKFSVPIDPPKALPTKIISSTKKQSKQNKGIDENSYCAQMLAASGLTSEDVTAHVFKLDDKKSTFQLRTFRPGTIDDKGNIQKGDDVIIEYYDLDGFPVVYDKKDAKKRPTGEMRSYFRVRWQYPNNHLDKTGKPYKYKSPPGSGTPIYIPERMRSMYKNGTTFERLYIQEGEKKAEKACKHNLPSVAVSGIANLGLNGVLPEDIVRIIQKCEVKEVVFLLDSDWDDISDNIKINDSVDRRPRNFYYAVRNFKDYMRSLKNREIYVEIYAGHIVKNAAGDKGLDDLLANTLMGKEEELHNDLEYLINEKNLTGKYVQLFRISGWTDHKIESLWSLDSPQLFAERHKDVLKNLPEFKIGRYRWRFNEEEKLELAQALDTDEEFWNKEERFKKDGTAYTVYEFRYVNSQNFLQNRGFGRFRRLDYTWQFVQLEPPVVRVIEASDARDFLFNFAKHYCCKDVNEMLIKGVSQYVGPDKLSLINFIEPHFLKANRDSQYFYFEKTCWEINAKSIKELDYSNITHHIWEEQRKNFSATLINVPMIRFSKGENGMYNYEMSELGKKCHFLRFLQNTSNFTWRKEQARAKGEQVDIDAEELQENKVHLLSKLCAIGYMLMECKDPNVSRAVVGMDGKQSEVGESNGRSGKSLIGELFRAVSTITYIDGKKRDMFADNFLWNDVVEKTKIVFIDDVLLGFRFENLFPSITGDWSVNYKGGRRVTFPFSCSPKIYISTNHAISGTGSSFTDRQWLLAFSDYYNSSHKPADDFGCLFFSEWDYDQWNLTWNLLANCIQLYLTYGVVESPGERLEQRCLRQSMTEEFISWAEEYFSSSEHINRPIVRKEMNDSYFEYVPNDRRYVKSTEFKKRIVNYCKWKGYTFNPHKYDRITGIAFKSDKDGRPVIDDKSGGIEYFTIGDENFYEAYKEDVFQQPIGSQLPFEP